MTPKGVPHRAKHISVRTARILYAIVVLGQSYDQLESSMDIDRKILAVSLNHTKHLYGWMAYRTGRDLHDAYVSGELTIPEEVIRLYTVGLTKRQQYVMHRLIVRCDSLSDVARDMRLLQSSVRQVFEKGCKNLGIPDSIILLRKAYHKEVSGQ